MSLGTYSNISTPVTHSVTILWGSMRLISHQTPGASKKWQQTPKHCSILSFQKNSSKNLPTTFVYTTQVWSASPPQKKHLGNFKFKHLPFHEVFPKGYPPRPAGKGAPGLGRSGTATFLQSVIPTVHTPQWVFGGFWNLPANQQKKLLV